MTNGEGRAGHLPADQRRLLQRIFDQFHATGEWPRTDELEYSFASESDTLDVQAVGPRIDSALGSVDVVSYEGRARLTLRGIYICDGGDQDLNDLAAVAQLALQRYLIKGVSAELSSSEVVAALAFDGRQLRVIRELIMAIPGYRGITGSSNESWTIQLSGGILRFKNVTTATDLLDVVRRQQLRGLPTPAEELAELKAKVKSEGSQRQMKRLVVARREARRLKIVIVLAAALLFAASFVVGTGESVSLIVRIVGWVIGGVVFVFTTANLFLGWDVVSVAARLEAGYVERRERQLANAFEAAQEDKGPDGA